MKIQFRHSHMDAAESVFFDKSLRFVRSTTYDIKFEELKGRRFVPVDYSVPSGASSHTYRQYDEYGIARWISNYSTDFPRADVLGREFTTPLKGMGASYGYSVQDIRAAMFAGVDLDSKKARSARRAVEEKLDSVIKTGDSALGLTGLLNQASAIVYTIPNGAGGLQAWTNKTPDEIVADMFDICTNMVDLTKENEKPNTLLMPVAQYGLISTRRMGDGSNETILSYFLKNSPYIKAVEQWSGCKAAGAGATDRLVAYRKDPDALVLIISQEFEQFPPQERGMETIIHCHLRTGGVVAFYPMSISYGDGI